MRAGLVQVSSQTKIMSGLFSKSPSRLADAIKVRSKLLKSETGLLPVYKIQLDEEEINADGCRRFSFGKESQPGQSNRTIMVLGGTGAGKTTLINGMINYILGVEWKDPYRFKLIDEGQLKTQAERQTSEVTVYQINHQEGFKIPFSLTIVDTPGFGDTRGIHRDKEITEQIRNLFSAERGVSEIDAVCFVVPASLARLTATQQYVLDSVLSIFGKDVSENIQVLVTFADGKRPPVLEAIKAAGVPCPETEDGLPVQFTFNNSALFAQNQPSAEEDGGFDQMFWKMGKRSMKRFFVGLDRMTTKSLTLTKEVLRERKQLEISIENVQKQVKVGLAQLEEINETTEQLRLHEAESSRNEELKKRTVQEVIDRMKAEYQHLQTGVSEMMKRSAECLTRLGEIALKPNPLSTPEYIDLLIEREKSEAKPGWKQRVEYLMEMRGQAELMGQVGRVGNPL